MKGSQALPWGRNRLLLLRYRPSLPLSCREPFINSYNCRCADYYRPQTKFAKVFFFFTGVCLSTGGRHAWLWVSVCGCGGAGMRGCGGACVVAGGVCGCRGCVWFQGVHVWLRGGIRGCKGACVVVGACMVVGGMHGIWLDTVNEWVVRILLECILVTMYVWGPWESNGLSPLLRPKCIDN